MNARIPGHVPVMLDEVLATLPLRPGAVVVDGTLGLAGHAVAMAARIAPGGHLIGVDWDASMLARARERLAQEAPDVEVRLFHADYRAIPVCLAGTGRRADAVLLDLGVSSVHLESPDRGFSFRHPGPLDMRMDTSRGEPAGAWLNRATAFEIERVLHDYGDEHWARRIAQVIVERRKRAPLQTTEDLVDCVLAAIPAAKRDRRIHPATRTFQAVRIFVNAELEDLEASFREIAGVLALGGVFAILAYHSGEDRAAKRAFRTLAQAGGFEELYRKPLTPSAAEIAENPKSRSAKLRALRRTEEPS